MRSAFGSAFGGFERPGFKRRGMAYGVVRRLSASDLPNAGVFNGTSDVYSEALSFDLSNKTIFLVATVTGTTAGTSAALALHGAGATNYVELQAAAAGSFRGRLRGASVGQATSFIDPASADSTVANTFNTKALFAVRVTADQFAVTVNNSAFKTMTKTGGTDAMTTLVIGRGRSTGFTAMTCHEVMIIDSATDAAATTAAADIAARHGLTPPVFTPYIDTTTVGLGDSIMVGVGSTAGLNAFAEIGTAKVLAKIEKTTPLTAIAGAQMSPYGETDPAKLAVAFSTITAISANFVGRSAVVVHYGTNDYNTDVPIGTSEDATDQTFWGAMNIGFDYLIAIGLPVVICTPFPRDGENVANGAGHTLQDYRDAITAKAAAVGAKVCDLATVWDYATESGTYTGDGLHPNDAGHLLGGQALAAVIKSGLTVPA